MYGRGNFFLFVAVGWCMVACMGGCGGSKLAKIALTCKYILPGNQKSHHGKYDKFSHTNIFCSENYLHVSLPQIH